MPLQPERLRQRRLLRGLTQGEMAQALQVSQQQIARWETGANDPSADAVARIARALECTSDWLLGLVNEAHAYVPEHPLSEGEQQLVELYRQRRLPQMIMRLVDELSAGTDAQEPLVIDSTNQPQVSSKKKRIDR